GAQSYPTGGGVTSGVSKKDAGPGAPRAAQRRGGAPGPGRRPAGRSFADVGHQRHEAGALDGVLDGPLEGGAVAAPLAAEQLALAGAELFQGLHILVIHKSRPWAALLGAEAAAILPAPSQFLANHRRHALSKFPFRFGET